jgi:hypothetical protein
VNHFNLQTDVVTPRYKSEPEGQIETRSDDWSSGFCRVNGRVLCVFERHLLISDGTVIEFAVNMCLGSIIL